MIVKCIIVCLAVVYCGGYVTSTNTRPIIGTCIGKRPTGPVWLYSNMVAIASSQYCCQYCHSASTSVYGYQTIV